MTHFEYMALSVNALKDAGKILIEQAENICADVNENYVNEISIWIRFEGDSIPTMQVEKDYSLRVFDSNKEVKK